MLTEKQLRELEAKIREAVPESMEHNFQWLTDNHATLCLNCFQYKEEDDVGECYGRDLNLQDVLIALAGDDGEWTEVVQKYRVTAPINYKAEVCDVLFDVYAEYDLTKDYQSQSPKFASFLYRLLL